MWSQIRRNLPKLSIQRSNWLTTVIISLLSAMFGIFGSEIIQELRPDWFAVQYRINLIFVVVTITSIMILLVSFTLWKSNVDYSKSLYLTAIAGVEKAEALPYKMAYNWATYHVRNADTEIILFTHFTYDPGLKREDYEPERMTCSERADLFKALREIIASNKIRYARMFQIPNGLDRNSFKTVLIDDKMYKEECEQIFTHNSKLGVDAKMKLVFTPFTTHMSFILIDQKYLLLNLDMYDPATKKYRSPFILVVEDKSNNKLFDSLWAYADYFQGQGGEIIRSF